MMREATILLLLLPLAVFAQGKDISAYIARVEAGEVEEVREDLRGLLEQYPNDPGVLYLQGLTTLDGADAVRIYQGIVDTFPQSEWADDALYKVHQFYYAIGLYRTAELKMEQLRRDYPRSQYASAPAESRTETLADETADVPPSPVPAPSGPAEGTLPVPSATRNIAGQFALQVGAYSSQENAEKQKLFFEDLGYAVEVINRLRDNRSLFLVLVGNYMTYEEARAEEEKIRKSHHVSSFVVSR